MVSANCTHDVQAVVDLAAQQAAAKVQTGQPGKMSQKAAAQAEAAVPTRQPALRLGLAWQVGKPVRSSISEKYRPFLAIACYLAFSAVLQEGMP